MKTVFAMLTVRVIFYDLWRLLVIFFVKFWAFCRNNLVTLTYTRTNAAVAVAQFKKFEGGTMIIVFNV